MPLGYCDPSATGDLAREMDQESCRRFNVKVTVFASDDRVLRKVLSLGRDVIIWTKKKLKTRMIKKDLNPEWNDDLPFSVSDPHVPMHLIVYDHDTFTRDDKMGDAEFDIKHFVDALRMNSEGFPEGTIITVVQPCGENWPAEESRVICSKGRIVQDMALRLRNVECGEVDIQLQWIDLPGSRGV